MLGAKGRQMVAPQLAVAPESRRGQYGPLSIAPMMDRTDRHYRCFMRQITRRTLLYTEMITASAILRGNQESCSVFQPENILWRCRSAAIIPGY